MQIGARTKTTALLARARGKRSLISVHEDRKTFTHDVETETGFRFFGVIRIGFRWNRFIFSFFLSFSLCFKFKTEKSKQLFLCGRNFFIYFFIFRESCEENLVPASA